MMTFGKIIALVKHRKNGEGIGRLNSIPASRLIR